MRALRLTAAVTGLALLSVAALVGVAISAGALWASTPAGREAVAGWVVGLVDRSLAGRFELAGVEVLPGGGVEIRGLRVFDPDERLVLAVDRAFVAADVTRLRGRVLGLEAELDRPSVLVEEEADGGISLLRAFAPVEPSEEAAPDGGLSLTVRVSRLALRGGTVWWRDVHGATRIEARDLEVDARGGYGPAEADLDLRLGASVDIPVQAPFSLEVKASLRRDALALPVLRVALGATALSAVGEGDLARRSGRLAVTRLAVDRGQARALAPGAGEGADLALRAYAESDGTLATAAATVGPAGATGGPAGATGGPAGAAGGPAGAAGGTAGAAGNTAGAAGGTAGGALAPAGPVRAAVAVRLADLEGGTPAAGLDLSLSSLDPARLLEGLPPGAITLSARGGASGSKLEDLRGRLEARLERSTLRGVAVGPGELRARADRGAVEVERLAVAGPGLTLDASGRWGRRAALSGRGVLDAGDLALASRAAGEILGSRVTPARGALRVEAALAGTGEAPELTATLSSRALSVGGTAARNVEARVLAAGPLRAARGEVDLTVESVRAGGEEVARLVAVKGKLAEGEATLAGSASVPSLGASSVAFSARGRMGERRETLVLSELGLSWPGSRWALTGAATVRIAGPSLDRLELASGDQRLSLEGGIAGKALDARVEASRLDLAKLPRGLLPEGAEGRLDLDARASGTAARPDATARFALVGGAAAGLEGIRAGGEARWDGRSRRARLALEAERRAGGRVEIAGEVPVPLASRPSEPLSLRATAEAIPLAESLLAAGLDLPLDGKVRLEVRLEGTAGAPSLSASAGLADGAWDDLYPVDLAVSADAPGDRLRVKVGLEVDGRRALAADAELPFDLGDALSRPADAPRAVLAAPIEATAEVPGFDLAAIAGAVGVPRDLAGVVEARAVVSGKLSAPRGTVAASASGLAVAGYKDLAGRLEVKLLADRVDLAMGASVAGAEVLRATGSVAGAPERLAGARALESSPLQLEAVVPRFDLARASSPAIVLAGVLEGRLEARGTARAPAVRIRLDGADLAVEGRPLGALAAEAAYADGKTTAELALRPRSGGTLTASGTLTAPIGLGVEADLGSAPLDARLAADALDLGFLPAVAPGVVREAEGRLDGEVRAKGPLSRPRPKGRLAMDGARIAVAEYGEWKRIALDLEVDDDAVELRRLEAGRGKGKLEAKGSVRGLAKAEAVVEASARLDRLTVARAGMDLATLDMRLVATGILRPGTGMDLEVRVPGGTVGVPKRIPRTLQTIEPRKDIAVGRPRERRRPPRVKPAPGAEVAAVEPFRLQVRTLVPGQLFVKGEDPRANVELKADVTYERAGAEEYASGEVEVVRGFVEPIGGRVFTLARGRVQFSGGPPAAALVDVEARWESQEGTKVTVVVAGPALDPQIKLTSQPPLDDAQIALLIATGRTDLKRGSGEVGSLSTEQAGYAAASAVVTKAFKSMLSDKLPIDTISLDASSVRAGTYLPNSKIYVGYVHRFEADLEKGQNQNEVSVEYQINPRWTLESRYGDGQSGSASLIWSRDY